jgi:hypothetical protein
VKSSISVTIDHNRSNFFNRRFPDPFAPAKKYRQSVVTRQRSPRNSLSIQRLPDASMRSTIDHASRSFWHSYGREPSQFRTIWKAALEAALNSARKVPSFNPYHGDKVDTIESGACRSVDSRSQVIRAQSRAAHRPASTAATACGIRNSPISPTTLASSPSLCATFSMKARHCRCFCSSAEKEGVSASI